MMTLSRAQLLCLVLSVLTTTAVSATARYRVFGFSALPTPPTTVNANGNNNFTSSGWISCDLHIGSVVWATDDSSGGTALVNVSLAVATTAGGDNMSAHSFESVTCNGEWVAMTRVVSNESTAPTVVRISFPFMSNPSSCAMRFLWPYCAGWASCDAGMELSWSEHKDASDAVVLGANIAGVTFQHTTISRSTKPSSSSPSVSSFCGDVAGSSNTSQSVRHLRIDLLGASNRWLSIANASASLISGGWQAGARNAAACRVRPYSMLRSLRELSLSPRNGLEVEPLDIVIDSTNGLATTWPLNYINVTSSSTAGQLPQCFSQTIAWFAGVVSEPELSLRIFLPTDDLMSLVISSNQSTQYVPLAPCSSSSNEATPSNATNQQQPPWLLPYLINNSSAPSFISGSFAYCGGYGGTPNVLLDVRNVSKEEGQGSITAVTMFGFVTVSSNGFIAPACPVTMTFNASSSSSAPAGRGDIDALVFVDVTPASQEEGGTNQQPPDCLEWNLANVGRTPWYQLQYHVACDRFWMATSFGAFPLTPCVQWPSTT